MSNLLTCLHEIGADFMLTYLLDEEGYHVPCFLIANNESQNNIDRIKDRENIAKVQDVLGLHGEPRWYKFIDYH